MANPRKQQLIPPPPLLEKGEKKKKKEEVEMEMEGVHGEQRGIDQPIAPLIPSHYAPLSLFGALRPMPPERRNVGVIQSKKHIERVLA